MRSIGTKEERTLWELTKKVWEAEGEYQDLAHWSRRFRMTIPISAMDVARSRQDLKQWRTIWKLELVVDHKPIQFVGYAISRTYTLNLYDHTTPSVPPPSPPQPMSIGNEGFSSQVFITTPHGAFGPGDTLPVSFQVKPDDPTATVKKALVIFERRLESRERSPSPPRPEKTGLFRISPRPLYSRLSSNGSEALDRPEKPLVHEIIKQSTETLLPGSNGSFLGNMVLTLPKRGNQWDIGETCTTDLVRVVFELKLRLSIKSGRSTKELWCPPIQVMIVGTNAEERRIAQIAAIPPVTPTKRKHRSSRRTMYMQEGTVDISTDLIGTQRRVARPKSPKLPSSPVLPITGVVTNIRPILRPASSSPPVSTQSISFAFPSALLNEPGPSHAGPSTHVIAPTLPPIQSLLDALAPTFESYSILQDYQSQSSGRRVSTTTSISEEEGQPSRSRQKVTITENDHDHNHPYRRGLPSLDALGLGLPVLPDDGRPRSRPRTAPIFSTTFHSARTVPPPLSGKLSSETERQLQFAARPVTLTPTTVASARVEEPAFAFGLSTAPGPPRLS
jgi:hypothetical protein